MRVRLEVSPESDVTVENDASGQVRAITFTPFFASRKGTAVLAYGKSQTDEGKELERFALGVSGGDGTLNKKTFNRTKAAADEPAAEQGNAGAPGAQGLQGHPDPGLHGAQGPQGKPGAQGSEPKRKTL